MQKKNQAVHVTKEKMAPRNVIKPTKKKIEILKKFETELLPKKLSDFSYLDMRYDNQVIAKNRTL